MRLFALILVVLLASWTLPWASGKNNYAIYFSHPHIILCLGSQLDCSIYNSNKAIIQSLPFRVDINPSVNLSGSSYVRVDYGGRVTDLTLTMVDSIPTSIFCLDSLKSLTIQYGTSLTIPPEIARLRSYLTSLSLIKISSSLTLPSELFNLTNLVSLSIISCGLETLPDAISQLSALNELDLTGNRLTSIPVTLAQISLLRTLVLNANPGLTSLDNLQGTQFLWNLNASNCFIDHLPMNVSNTGVIELNGNQLTSLANLETIISDITTVISLKNNNITVLPTTIRKATKLEILDLSNNQLTELPEVVYSLSALKTLILSKNSFSRLEIEWIQGRFRTMSAVVIL
ncbi:unnamed protein product [Rotaria socialis]|uniref:L domain-like protein n=2 Tax=Rotaria socialis TaxID=392032 RepID=A0A818NR55_9BILA|nr:unnamed protein product [Rotaria socialis]CAF4638993.1 unnamed protein product [Rotaria socialis]